VARVHDSIEVEASCEVVFRHLYEFEHYPQFLAGVREVRRPAEDRLHWSVVANGRTEQWEAEIVENIPPHRLAWRARGHDGVITCRATPWGKAKVFLSMDQEPLQPAPDGRHYLEATLRRMHADLENFREWVEHAGAGERGGAEAERTGPALPA
jgi:uncharacterized membrane protein